MSNRMQAGLAILLLVASMTATWLFVRKEMHGRSAGAPPSGARAIQTDLNAGAAARSEGASNASARLVVFFDYQCPSCARMQRAIDTVLAKDADWLAVEYRDFPLESIHAVAYAAAVASRCAARQGEFSVFHRILFDSAALVARKEWRRIAATAGIPRLRDFSRCVQDPTVAAEVASDIELAASLRLVGTPSFLIGDSLYAGERSASDLGRLVRQATRASR